MRDARLGIRYLKLNDNGIDVNKADYEARLAVALPLLKELDCDTVAGALTLIDSGVHYEQQQHTSETMAHAAKQIMLLREEGFGMRQRGIDSYTSPFTRVVMDNLEGECRLMTAQAISHRQFNRGRTPEGITASLASLARLTYFPHLPSWQAGHRFGANGYKDLWSANTLLTLIRKFRDKLFLFLSFFLCPYTCVCMCLPFFSPLSLSPCFTPRHLNHSEHFLPTAPLKKQKRTTNSNEFLTLYIPTYFARCVKAEIFPSY